MKKYGVLGRVWENVVITVGLSLTMMVIREIKQGRFYQGHRLEALIEDFSGILLLVGILITTLQLMYANYAQTECQFRYCGTAIPFLTVRSTAR